MIISCLATRSNSVSVTMFLRRCSPISANSASTLPRTLTEGVFRDADAVRLGDSLQPRCDVDAVALDVALLNNDVAEIHTNPECDPLFLWCPGIALDHPLLHGNRAGDGLDHARELDQNAVAGRLNARGVR